MGGLLPFRETTTLVGTGEWGLVSELLRFRMFVGRPLLGTCQTWFASSERHGDAAAHGSRSKLLRSADGETSPSTVARMM